MAEDIIHVTVDDATEEEAREILSQMEKATADDTTVVMSDSDTAVHELPAIDDYLDELADRVADRL